jgi:hypothetical protein
MLKALDPNATWEYELPGQEDLAPEERVVLVSRFLTVRQANEARASRTLALDGERTTTDAAYIEAVMAVFRIAGTRVTRGGKDLGDADTLQDIATLGDLWEWGGAMIGRQTLSETERKNSASRQPGSQAPSAVSAGPGHACGTAQPS